MPPPTLQNDTISVILGNPVRSQAFTVPRNSLRHSSVSSVNNISIERHGARFIFSDSEEEICDSGSTCFFQQANLQGYEGGYFFIVRYWWNEEQVDCIENGILKKRMPLDAETFAYEVLPKVKNLHPVTTLKIRTAGGSIEVSELSRTIPEGTTYPPIPDSMTRIPRWPISDLQKCHVGPGKLSDDIDIVTLGGNQNQEWFAFKRYPIPLEYQFSPMEDLLSEVECMARFNSPYIIKPSFLVTDNEDNSLFRGYLIPFMPAGTLNDVFEELPTRGPLSQEPVLSHPKLLELYDGPEVRIKSATPRLPWNVKHTWAIEATSAVATLHDCGFYNGDIKAANILLDRNGHLQLIDLEPEARYTADYIAPEFNLSERNYVDYSDLILSEARDMYAFGIVLWQIAEEMGNIDLSARPKPFDPIWRSESVPESTPQWYQDLVARCVNSDQSMRPSAKEVLQVLKAGE